MNAQADPPRVNTFAAHFRGWNEFFAGKAEDDCPFGRGDIGVDYSGRRIKLRQEWFEGYFSARTAFRLKRIVHKYGQF